MGFGIPKLYVRFWWPSFLAMKFTFLFQNVQRGGGGGATGLGNIPKKNIFFSAFLIPFFDQIKQFDRKSIHINHILQSTFSQVYDNSCRLPKLFRQPEAFAKGSDPLASFVAESQYALNQ